MNQQIKNLIINSIIAYAGISVFASDSTFVEQVLIGLGSIIAIRGGIYLVQKYLPKSK